MTTVLKLFTLFLFLASAMDSQAQDLYLYSGKKQKKFNSNELFTIAVPKAEELRRKKCEGDIYKGFITSTVGDSITIEAKNIETTKAMAKVNKYELITVNPNTNLVVSIAKKDILYIVPQKSLKRKKTMQNLAAVFLVTGSTTLLNTLAVAGKSNRKNLVIAGGIQLGLTTALLSISSSKKYYLKNGNKYWRFEK